MKRQTRYDVRHASKSALKTIRYEKPNEEIFEIFWEMYSNLGNNKNFNILEKQYIKSQIFSLMESGLAYLFFVMYNDQIVNVAFASNFGQAAYLYGAMNSNFKNRKGFPSPGHLAQWEMITTMKAKGLKIYDLGFCPGPIPYSTHPRYHIWRFKYGFGGDHVEFLPTYGKVLRPLRGKIYQYVKYRL
jgi:lipid II:glycine glycyltransferase (peptidoglycan interpeptide bridge formation enzyme)